MTEDNDTDAEQDQDPTIRFELSHEQRDGGGEWGYAYEGPDLSPGRWLTRADLVAIKQACENAIEQQDEQDETAVHVTGRDVTMADKTIEGENGVVEVRHYDDLGGQVHIQASEKYEGFGTVILDRESAQETIDAIEDALAALDA